MKFSKDELSVIGNFNYAPSVSLILPLRPQIAMGKEFRHRLKSAIDSVKRQLEELYPADKCEAVLNKLNNIQNEVDYEQMSAGIAIYVSPVVSKIFYLDVDVEEKMIIDESFEIRDLVYAHSEVQKYLILLLSSSTAKAFVGTGHQLRKVSLGVPDNVDAFQKDLGPRVANFSDPDNIKQVVVENFLRNIDDGLGNILKTEKLPVILLGVDKVLGYFNGMTKHEKAIKANIHGNYDDYNETKLAELVAPYVHQIHEQDQKMLFNEIEKAMNARKLSAGINEVMRAAEEKRGRLLIVEKNYVYKSKYSQNGYLYETEPENETGFYIKDAVDDAIQKTIQNGGDVRFVDEGDLKDFMQIVMIENGAWSDNVIQRRA